MTGAAEVDKPMSASEIDRLRNRAPLDALRSSSQAARASPVYFKDRIARPAKPPAAPPRRRPLGLRPAGDDAAHEASPSEAGFDDPTVALVAESSALLVDLIEDQRRHFESKVAGLANTIGKLQNENQALKLILENLRITQRGELGIDGDRGPPGRDGRDGEGKIGPAGPVGPKGLDAPRIVSWEISDSDFVAYPLLSTGHKGPGLDLRGLFEAFSEQINAEDDAAEIDAARASREATERETQAARAHLR
jgi:hypothetical protein